MQRRSSSEEEGTKLDVELLRSSAQDSNPGFVDDLNMGKKCVVVFHAPWCGHCTQFMPIWHEAHAEYNSMRNDNKVKWYAVNSEMDKALMRSQRIDGFPTVRFYHSRTHHVPFKGSRTVSALRHFVTSFQ